MSDKSEPVVSDLMGYQGQRDQFDADLKKVSFIARKHMYCGRDYNYGKNAMLEECGQIAGIADPPDAVKRALLLAYSAGVMQGDMATRDRIVAERESGGNPFAKMLKSLCG